MKMLDYMETGLNVLGVAIGVSDVDDWINLALLITSLLALIARSVFKIIDWVKKKDYDKASQELEKLHDDIDNMGKKEDTDEHD